MSWSLLLHDPYHDDRAGVADPDDAAAATRRLLAYGVRARLGRSLQGLSDVVDDEVAYLWLDDEAVRRERRIEASSKAPAA